MIPTNPTHGADGHSGASASNKPNTNPTHGADASNSVNGTPSENVNKTPLANGVPHGKPNGKPNDNSHEVSHEVSHESKSVNNHEGVSVNAQAAQSQRVRSYNPDIRPVLTLEEMGKIAVAASRRTWIEDDDPATAIAQFYQLVYDLLEGLHILRGKDVVLLLRMVRPFLEAPTTTQEEKEEGWRLVGRIIKNIIDVLGEQVLENVSTTASQYFLDYRVFV